MDGPSDFLLKRGIHHFVLFNQVFILEIAAHHRHPKMVPGSGQILNLYNGPGEFPLQPVFDFVRFEHGVTPPCFFPWR